MRSLFIIVIGLLTVNFCCGETIAWHRGVVVLRSDEVLTGELAIHPAHDVVLFRQSEQVMVYPAHKIQSVYYYDAAADINRKFIVIQQSSTAAFSACRLFEIVLSGEVSIIRRVASAVSNQADDANGYNYYLRSGNDLIALHKFQSKLYPRLLQESGTLSDYIRENKLNPGFDPDVIRIVDYYNKERNMNQATAALQHL